MTSVLTAVAYVVNVVIIGTYLAAAQGRPLRWFHWANALGALPLLAYEVVVGAWAVMPLTAAFGTIALVGLWRR